MAIVIHHNPACGTSRNVLETTRKSGTEPTVIPYLDTGWTEPQLLALFAAAALTPRSALRTTKLPAEELGLLDAAVGEAALLAAMPKHPVPVNRPIVCTPNGVRLCRPSEVVLALLDTWPPGTLYKDDGEMVLDANGHRVAG